MAISFQQHFHPILEIIDSENFCRGHKPESALDKVGDTVEGYGASLLVKKNAKLLNIDLKLLDYLISIYEGPKDLSG